MTWVTVYDIRHDAERVRQIQEATLNRPGFGLVPEPALFGSDEWWQAIDDGRVTATVEEGVVGVVRWGSMGDWPVWRFRSADGTESEWTREGDYTRYVEGLPARITTVITRWKATPRLSGWGSRPRTQCSLRWNWRTVMRAQPGRPRDHFAPVHEIRHDDRLNGASDPP
jgi:hypothetical protein